MDFILKGDYIKLDQLLKAANIAGSGGEAKILIEEGSVLYNGEIEMRRGKKIYRGDRVTGKEDKNIDITVL